MTKEQVLNELHIFNETDQNPTYAPEYCTYILRELGVPDNDIIKANFTDACAMEFFITSM